MEMTTLAEIRDYEQLSASMDLAKDIITKDYLYQLEKYEVCEMPEELKDLEISAYTRLYKFKRFVSDKKENTIDKMVTVLNEAYMSRATVITLIKGNVDYTDYYLGVVNKDIEQVSYDIGTQGEAFKGVLSGNFPGLVIKQLADSEIQSLCSDVFSYDYITSVSGIASIRNEKEKDFEKYVQGIEHLVDSLQGREYSVLVIADPVHADEIALAKNGYENLYTQLSPFLKTSLSFNESDTLSVSSSHTEGVTQTIGESLSRTQNYSRTNGWSESFSYGTSRNKETGALVGAAVGMAAVGGLAGITGGALAAGVLPGILKGLAVLPAAGIGVAAGGIGSAVGTSIGRGLIGSFGESDTEGNTESGSTTEASGNSVSQNTSSSTQDSDTESQSESNSHGRTLQLSNENKTVKNLLDRIDKQMERLNMCEAYGAFHCATYVISSDPETNAMVANGYSALMRGDNSALQASYINAWDMESDGIQEIRKYLQKFSHPLFRRNQNTDLIVSPASMESSYELAVSIGIPKRSINGLPVFEAASFGRNVFEVSTSTPGWPGQKIHIGNIFHMGSEEHTSVDLDVKSLAMHTFITGSTGSGKSNTVYQILRELLKKKVGFLVIEPAKGEYKHIFADTDVHVYGTNPYCMPLLRIDPFQFPEEIHVLEHIDRLIEIFNVCWPMYAAMPAVLKDSVERAYRSAGWNLDTSKNRYHDRIFPSFVDVMHELNRVVAESAFSQEVKDNYIGSLATRIRSLTNGIYGRIFTSQECGDAALFDQNVIIDLSRVGSVETKSMIMGILVMRLQEYRMTAGDMNADLKHVTVLEEAHNLLKRTSTEQSSESANLLGKSVEMLSNAIAEVRTYGEGFIIADQAPGLLDMSVIRNTNTKIIMRLPDAEDRVLVGRSANLSDEQIKELAKMPTGVGAVYQNNWLEPVLCKIRYEKAEGIYRAADTGIEWTDHNAEAVLLNLLHKAAGERLDMNLADLTACIVYSTLPVGTKVAALQAVRHNGTVSLKQISSVVYEIVCDSDLEQEAEKACSIQEWKDVFLYSGNLGLSELEVQEQNMVTECILMEQIERFGKPKEYLETWRKFVDGEVM